MDPNVDVTFSKVGPASFALKQGEARHRFTSGIPVVSARLSSALAGQQFGPPWANWGEGEVLKKAGGQKVVNFPGGRLVPDNRQGFVHGTASTSGIYTFPSEWEPEPHPRKCAGGLCKELALRQAQDEPTPQTRFINFLTTLLQKLEQHRTVQGRLCKDVSRQSLCRNRLQREIVAEACSTDFNVLFLIGGTRSTRALCQKKLPMRFCPMCVWNFLKW